MTRYKNKPIDDIVKADDTLLASNNTGESVNITVQQMANFTAEKILYGGMSYTYASSGNTEDEDTDNYFTFDAEDLALVTEINLNDKTLNNFNVRNLLSSITPLLTDLKFQLKVEKTDDPSVFHYFKIGSITDNTTHFTLEITKSSSQTSGGLIDEAKYFIKIEPSSEGDLNEEGTIVLQNQPLDLSDDGEFPGGPNVKAGYKYIVTVAGIVDGINFNIGDALIAKVDNPSVSTFSGQWIHEINTDTVYDDTVIQATVASKADNAEFQDFKLANDQAVILKGSWDATTPFPASTEAGYKYIVSVEGTQDGIDFKIGDSLISLLDNASTTTYLNNWHHQPLASESGFIDITWVALVALATREAGQKYNITTANPDDSIIYGQVILDTPNTFRYEHTPIDVETIIID